MIPLDIFTEKIITIIIIRKQGDVLGTTIVFFQESP